MSKRILWRISLCSLGMIGCGQPLNPSFDIVAKGSGGSISATELMPLVDGHVFDGGYYAVEGAMTRRGRTLTRVVSDEDVGWYEHTDDGLVLHGTAVDGMFQRPLLMLPADVQDGMEWTTKFRGTEYTMTATVSGETPNRRVGIEQHIGEDTRAVIRTFVEGIGLAAGGHQIGGTRITTTALDGHSRVAGNISAAPAPTPTPINGAPRVFDTRSLTPKPLRYGGEQVTHPGYPRGFSAVQPEADSLALQVWSQTMTRVCDRLLCWLVITDVHDCYGVQDGDAPTALDHDGSLSCVPGTQATDQFVGNSIGTFPMGSTTQRGEEHVVATYRDGEVAHVLTTLPYETGVPGVLRRDGVRIDNPRVAEQLFAAPVWSISDVAVDTDAADALHRDGSGRWWWSSLEAHAPELAFAKVGTPHMRVDENGREVTFADPDGFLWRARIAGERVTLDSLGRVDLPDGHRLAAMTRIGNTLGETDGDTAVIATVTGFWDIELDTNNLTIATADLDTTTTHLWTVTLPAAEPVAPSPAAVSASRIASSVAVCGPPSLPDPSVDGFTIFGAPVAEVRTDPKLDGCAVAHMNLDTVADLGEDMIATMRLGGVDYELPPMPPYLRGFEVPTAPHPDGMQSLNTLHSAEGLPYASQPGPMVGFFDGDFNFPRFATWDPYRDRWLAAAASDEAALVMREGGELTAVSIDGRTHPAPAPDGWQVNDRAVSEMSLLHPDGSSTLMYSAARFFAAGAGTPDSYCQFGPYTKEHARCTDADGVRRYWFGEPAQVDRWENVLTIRGGAVIADKNAIYVWSDALARFRRATPLPPAPTGTQPITILPDGEGGAWVLLEDGTQWNVNLDGGAPLLYDREEDRHRLAFAQLHDPRLRTPDGRYYARGMMLEASMGPRGWHDAVYLPGDELDLMTIGDVPVPDVGSVDLGVTPAQAPGGTFEVPRESLLVHPYNATDPYTVLLEDGYAPMAGDGTVGATASYPGDSGPYGRAHPRSPDGRYLLLGGDTGSFVLDLATGGALELPGVIFEDAAFSADGSTVVCHAIEFDGGGSYRTLAVRVDLAGMTYAEVDVGAWDGNTKLPLSLSPNGRVLAAKDSLWDLDHADGPGLIGSIRPPRATIPSTDGAYYTYDALQFLANGQLLASSAHVQQIWTLNEGGLEGSGLAGLIEYRNDDGTRKRLSSPMLSARGDAALFTANHGTPGFVQKLLVRLTPEPEILSEWDEGIVRDVFANPNARLFDARNAYSFAADGTLLWQYGAYESRVFQGRYLTRFE